MAAQVQPLTKPPRTRQSSVARTGVTLQNNFKAASAAAFCG